MENLLFEAIEKDFRLQIEDTDPGNTKGLDKKWQGVLTKETKRFINPDFSVDREAMSNFRHPPYLMIPDAPSWPMEQTNWHNTVFGLRRGTRMMMLDHLDILERLGEGHLLMRYPASTVGNPILMQHKGYVFTYRWLRHIHSLALFLKHLADKSTKDSVCLDLGSGWGIFSSLLHQEKKTRTNVLLDFPEMLVLARYFLGQSHPDATFAPYEEIRSQDILDHDFLRQYDFVLLPHWTYPKLTKGAVDMMVNVASLGEMSRKWFNFYLDSNVFRGVRWTIFINRFESSPVLEPTYDTDLTLLDYPLHDFSSLRFGVCPLFSYSCESNGYFSYRKRYFSSQYFEFVGERTVLSGKE